MNGLLELEGGGKLALDENGHLADGDQWSEQVAQRLAAVDGTILTDAHWVVLEILREYYAEFGIEPPMRALVRMMKEKGAAKHASSLALYRLFPEGPARQGSRYAGLPLPVSCI